MFTVFVDAYCRIHRIELFIHTLRSVGVSLLTQTQREEIQKPSWMPFARSSCVIGDITG